MCLIRPEPHLLNINISGISELVKFEEQKADICEIPGIYYRWAIDIKGGTFQVSAKNPSWISRNIVTEWAPPESASQLQIQMPAGGYL